MKRQLVCLSRAASTVAFLCLSLFLSFSLLHCLCFYKTLRLTACVLLVVGCCCWRGRRDKRTGSKVRKSARLKKGVDGSPEKTEKQRENVMKIETKRGKAKRGEEKPWEAQVGGGWRGEERSGGCIYYLLPLTFLYILPRSSSIPPPSIS